MDQTSIEGVESHCPLCNEPVLRIREITNQQITDKGAKCSNEFFIHKGIKLYKILDPITPTDVDRKKYE